MGARIHREERGTVGRLVLVWLVLVLVIGLAAVDAGSILFAKYRVTDLAGNAASAAADTYNSTKSQQQACQAAVTLVQQQDSQSTIPKKGCSIDATSGDATVTVRRLASTIVVKHVAALRKYERVSSTQTAAPPVL